MNLRPRLLATAALTCLSATLLTACAGESQAQSIIIQKQQVTSLAKLVPAKNRIGEPLVSGGTSVDKSGSYFPCDASNRQFVTGRIVDVKNLKPQAFIESLKPRLEAQGYQTSWYAAAEPRSLVADKGDFEFRFNSVTDKRDAKNPVPAVSITSFGKCFPVEK